MQEDITGTLRTIGHDVATCSLCGAPYPIRALTPLEATPQDGVLSERADVCPECAATLARGDDPVVRPESAGELDGDSSG